MKQLNVARIVFFINILFCIKLNLFDICKRWCVESSSLGGWYGQRAFARPWGYCC